MKETCGFCGKSDLEVLKSPALGGHAIIYGCSECDSVFMRPANGITYHPADRLVRILGSYKELKRKWRKHTAK